MGKRTSIALFTRSKSNLIRVHIFYITNCCCSPRVLFSSANAGKSSSPFKLFMTRPFIDRVDRALLWRERFFFYLWYYVLDVDVYTVLLQETFAKQTTAAPDRAIVVKSKSFKLFPNSVAPFCSRKGFDERVASIDAWFP